MIFTRAFRRDGPAKIARNRFDTPITQRSCKFLVNFSAMSIASRERNPMPPPNAPLEEHPPLFEHEPPFFGRPELNRWHPAFDTQLAAELAEHEEEGEQDEGGLPRSRVHMGIPPAQVRPLDFRLMSAVRALNADLTAETAGRDRLQTATPTDLFGAAETFARYRLTSLGILRHTDRDSRRMFLSDLRELGRCSFPQMRRIMQLLARFTPQIKKSRDNDKVPLFEELAIPERLRNSPADLSPMGAFLKPSQLMTNYVSRELARGECQTPSYTPYIVAGVSTAPWPVPSAEHTAAMAQRTTNKQASEPGLNLSPFTLGLCIACALSLPLIFALHGSPLAACPLN